MYIYITCYTAQAKKRKEKKEKCIKLAQPQYCCLFFLVSLFYFILFIYFLMFFYFSHGFHSNLCLDIHKANNTMGNYIYTPVHIAENLTQRKLNTIAFKPPPPSLLDSKISIHRIHTFIFPTFLPFLLYLRFLFVVQEIHLKSIFKLYDYVYAAILLNIKNIECSL